MKWMRLSSGQPQRRNPDDVRPAPARGRAFSEPLQDSSARPIEAFQAMSGVAFVTPVAVVAEVGDFMRFNNPRKAMACWGLTPSEHSSGTAVRRSGVSLFTAHFPRLCRSAVSNALFALKPTV